MEGNGVLINALAFIPLEEEVQPLKYIYIYIHMYVAGEKDETR